MEKILSVCIPSYNMEKYLRRNLDSFLVPECLDALELIVVNDGSKDRTLEIANEYKAKYPDTVVVIDKANGHYGSCVNAALKIATGKYFRIVDADDWVDSEALKEVVRVMSNIDADVVYTRFSTFYEATKTCVQNKDIADAQWKRTISLNDIKVTSFVKMHQISYKLTHLKEIEYTQTEGICYTDVEYVFKPLSCAKSIYFCDVSLYQYFMGRDDQSVSPLNAVKNFMHFHKVFDSVYSYIPTISPNASCELLRWIYVKSLVTMLVELLFATCMKNKEWNKILKDTFYRLEKDGVDITTFLEIKFKGMGWVNWWYRGGIISNVKLCLLFTALKIRKYLK